MTMATRKPKAAAPADDDLDQLFDGIGEERQAPTKAPSKAPKPAVPQDQEDLLAELESLGVQQPSERPQTPRISKRAVATPPPGSSRTSEDKPVAPRKSADSTRSFHTSFTPSATSSDLQEAEKKAPIAQPAEEAPATGGGWWGSVFATASAAVKTAEAAVKEIQKNEEAQRWAEQVKGNVGALRGLGKLLLYRLRVYSS